MKKILETISELLETFIISVVLFLLIYAFLAFPEIVIGGSMEPTLYGGERLLVERITPKFNRLKRGDIVIFKPPGNNNIDYVKRIVGLPGETLVVKDCRVFVSSESLEEVPVEESYLSPDSCTVGEDNTKIPVPKDSFFVMGDNRNHSADSRFFGVVRRNRIDGRVFARFWPLDKLSVF